MTQETDLNRRAALKLTLAAAASALHTGQTNALAGLPVPLDESPATDRRLTELKDLNGYFPFSPSDSPAAWEQRRQFVERQMLVACGLWPMPSRPTVQATVHGRVERDGYTVDRVFFESSPGLFVTGSLYKPAGATGRLPTIISPHGHWNNGRFHRHNDAEFQRELDSDAELFECGRHPLQARAVHLTRMGCMVFLYDMQGYADARSFSYDLIHRFAAQRDHLSSPDRWGLFSAQSELRLLNALGIQTWNSVRILDWLETRDDCDTDRIGVTGASGGGTQTFMIAALDDRISAAFPAVMVSTAMQGGCTCENASHLRINTGNIEFAAMVAPRPVFMSAANDWTVDLETKGLPELRRHFEMLEIPDRVDGRHFEFPHNYNRHSRRMMYEFFNRFLGLGAAEQQLEEREFMPLSIEEATVWNDEYPAPPGTEESEMAILQAIDRDLNQQVGSLVPANASGISEFRRVVGGGWEAIIGRRPEDIGELKFTADPAGTDKQPDASASSRIREFSGRLHVVRHGEFVPVRVIIPTDWSGDVAVWADGNGFASLPEGYFGLPARGCAIVAADLLNCGTHVGSDGPWDSAPVVDNPRQFAGYTLGYNHPLFAQQVHDCMAVTEAVRRNLLPSASASATGSEQQDGNRSPRIHLLGTNGLGPAAAAAAVLCGDRIHSIGVETDGFRFSSVTDIRDQRLLPGAVRYGDVPMLLALCSPLPLAIVGEPVPEAANKVYSVSGAECVTLVPGDRDAGFAFADWIMSRSPSR